MRHCLALYGLILCLWVSCFSHAAEFKSAWQVEWERTVKAAEEEGQLTVYIAGYGALIDSGLFQKTYPKIKVTSVTGWARSWRRASSPSGAPKSTSPTFTAVAAGRCIKISISAKCSIRSSRR